jgi:DNA-binding response OmpR family regulator
MMGERPGHSPLHYEQPSASKRQRVLVVDDHVPMAVAVARLIQVMGHEARITHDGTTALSCLGGYCPDIILLDIGLPGMNGYEVARRIRATADGSRPRLVALTGLGDVEDAARAYGAGFDVYLIKPVGFAALAEVLEHPPNAAPLDAH